MILLEELQSREWRPVKLSLAQKEKQQQQKQLQQQQQQLRQLFSIR